MIINHRRLLNRPGFKTISRRYMMRNYPVFVNPAWLWTISRQYIFGLRHWNHALINHWVILFKYQNLDEISLWYWMNKVFMPDYIILNSQHGWILLWLSITSIMIEVFKVTSARWLLSMDIIYSTIEGIVPSRCRLTTRHLGATLFKLRLH